MLRIVFTSDDLGRTRVAPAPDPVWELVLSLHTLQARTREEATAGWRREVHDALRREGQLRHIQLLLGLNPPRGYFPDFLTPYDSLFGLQAGLEAVRSTPITLLQRDLNHFAAGGHPLPTAAAELARGDSATLKELTAAMERYGEIAIEPYWPRLRAAIDADRARRTRALLDGGTEGLLASLRPAMRWADSGVLEIHDYPTSRELHLDGRGLLLVPSYFCVRTPVALVDPTRPPVLVYPVDRLGGLPSTATIACPEVHIGRQRRGSDGAEALGALLGRTRAAVLQAVGDGSSTGEISRRLGISQAAASQHTTVLRNAGLLVTQRDRNTVLHTLTPLGHSLLTAP